MYADGLIHYGGDVRGRGGDGDRWDGDGVGIKTGVMGMGRNLWGWSGYGENKLSPCSSLQWRIIQELMEGVGLGGKAPRYGGLGEAHSCFSEAKPPPPRS